MKKSLLLVLSAMILFAVPSCKKQKCEAVCTKRTLTEEFVCVNPCQKEEAKKAEEPKKQKEEPKTPRLWRFQAKKLVKDALKAKGLINNPQVVPVKLGYYECNSRQTRELLYKAQVNGLVDVTYTDLINNHDRMTYWVDAALTAKGQALVCEDNATVFPEDTINAEYMASVVNPNSGKNKYGEYTFDPYVDSAVVALVKDFYGAYTINKLGAIKTYGSNDLLLAQQRIEKAKELGIRKMADPFLRKVKIDSTSLANLSVYKWTSFVDLYVVKVAGTEFCLVIVDDEEGKKIDDVALATTAKLVKNRTMRCTALNITAKELHNAQKKYDAKVLREQKKKSSKAVSKVAKKEELLYGEYMPDVMPGIEAVVRTEPTPYQLAKQAEYSVVYNLLAGDAKLQKLSKIKDVKIKVQEEDGTTVKKVDPNTKKAVVTIKQVKVSPLGRICKGLVDGEKTELKVVFRYDDDEEKWTCQIER